MLKIRTVELIEIGNNKGWLETGKWKRKILIGR